MKHLLLLIVLFVCIEAAAQQPVRNQTPTEDELLNFDNVEGGEDAPTAAPPPNVAEPETPSPSETASESPPPPESAEAPPSGAGELSAGSEVGAGGGEGVNDADQRFEARLARIYQKYNSSEISDDEWAKIAGDRSAETYTLQEGDTLWDISTKFFGNGFYWPKVWQLNDTITNPHNVKVADTLRFSPGSVTSPPQLEVDQNDPEIEAPPTAAAPDETKTASQIVIPRGKQSRPVLQTIPPSFPGWQQESGDYNQNGFSKSIVNRYQLSAVPQSALASLILERPWESQGEVVEMEGGLGVASNYQMIIVEIPQGASPGAIYTVYSINDEIEDPVTDDDVGVEIYTRAEIEINESIEGSPNSYRALVKKAVLPVRIGDQLVVGNQIARIEHDTNGAQSSVSARIVNAEHGNRKNLILHSVVFLNKGSADGLTVGSLLPVIKNVQLRNSDSRIKFDSKPIGLLKVAHVSERVSTAVVVEEKDPIIPGDETALIATSGDQEPMPTDTSMDSNAPSEIPSESSEPPAPSDVAPSE
ncbi:MAG: LysM peptidoglycan-binding domain-containing protein, partial [Oligoflexia bacterium]|nr:LysM peptidoglycan-binding domain-containing protein [Oligoflexia bacterium]